MKNNLFTKKILDSDSLLSAVKKAQGKAGAGINATTSSIGVGIPSNAKITNAELNDSISPYYSAAWLKAADNVNPLDRQITDSGNSTWKTPRMSEVQKDEEGVRSRYKETLRPPYRVPPMSEIQKDEPLVREELTIEQEGRNDHLYETLFDKPYDETSNNDFDMDTVTPSQFTGISPEEQKRRYDAAMKRAAQSIDDFYTYLGSSEIKINELTQEQKEIVELVKNELVKQSVLGTLTRAEKARIIRETTFYLYANTKPTNGDPYPVVMELKDPKYESQQMMPPLGMVSSNVLSEADQRLIFECGDNEYKQQVYSEAIDAYNAALRAGKVQVGNYQEFYDQAVLKFYNNYLKPIPVTNNKGFVVDTVKIGDLVDPMNVDFNAQVALNALERLGEPYKNVDCSGLVKWAYSQIDPLLAKKGIGGGARYQRGNTEEDFIWKRTDYNTELPVEKLLPGDLLYWENEDGETVHTAIYLGSGYMIESAGTVKVTPLRMYTSYGDGHGSNLVQVNRPDEDRLYQAVDEKMHTA